MIQGTEQLLRFVTDLRESAEDSLSVRSHRRTAERCLMAAEIIERLAQYEPDLEVKLGEG